ncbi:MAG: hypothetical protein Q7T54_00320 [Candidatus Levybacteria bacterium]|nr:hypothetical protein [Candidatus Levybacteria bacterium]
MNAESTSNKPGIDILEAIQARFRTPESRFPEKTGRFAPPIAKTNDRPDYTLHALQIEDNRLKGEFLTAILNPNSTTTEI